jgi:hypothetical protein
VVAVVDLEADGIRLTADGEVDLLGHAEAYLATWRTRASAGEVAPPWSWNALRYDFDGSRLELPALPDEADCVAALLADILGRDGMTERIPSRRKNGRRRTRR